MARNLVSRALQEKLMRILFRMRNLLLYSTWIRRLDFDECKLWIKIDSPIEFFIRANSCKKEPKTIDWLRLCAEQPGVFFDVGANIGAYSLVAASYGLKVFSFEPSYINFNQLHHNIRLNKLDHFITPVNLAVSDRTKISKFRILDEATGTSKCFYNEANEFHYVAAVISAPSTCVISLDDFIQTFNTPIPNYLKVDVDGAELDVISGAKNLLHRPELRSIQVEIDNKKDSAETLITRILDSGFKIDSTINFRNHISNYVFNRK